MRADKADTIKWETWDQVIRHQAGTLEERVNLREAGLLRPEDLFIPTGLRKWDANGGLTRGVLTVLAGVDGMGKSFVSNHLARHAAERGLQVAQIVFEDPKEQTANRALANLTGIDSRKLGLVTFHADDIDRIYAATRATSDWGRNIHCHYGLADAQTVLGALKSLPTKPDLVLLDYAQALPEGDEGLERTIAHLAWDANVFAQETNCAFVVFSQVKPEISNRGHAAFWAARRRDPDSWDVTGFIPGPGTQDLAWSAAFGQRARAVGYIFRPGYYLRMLGQPGAQDNRLVIRWAKVSFGNSGVMELGFDGACGRIYDLDKD